MNRLRQLAMHPVNGASLGVFRAVFGGLVCLEMLRYWVAGIHRDTFLVPTFHFKYAGFEWLEPLPEGGMQLVFLAMVVGSAMVAVGWKTRVGAWVLFLSFTYGFLLEAAAYRNHTYLIALLAGWFIFLPSDRRFALDAGKYKDEEGVVPLWSLWAMRFQIGVVYLFAGLAKLDPLWLSGGSMRAVIAAGGHDAATVAMLNSPVVLNLLVFSGLALDLFALPLLLWARTRKAMFISLAAFHLINALFLVDVGVFPWFMLAVTTLFFAPDWPDALKGSQGPSEGRPREADKAASNRMLSMGGTAALLAVVVVQMALPLRHHVYPGSSTWTHEGHRWAWRMKLVAKEVDSYAFFAKDAETGQRFDLTPNADLALTAWQREKMLRQPDLMVQFVADMARRVEEQIGRDVTFHADIRLSEGGGPVRALIDTTYDLSQARSGMAPAPYILR